jgi:tetratricopeptide (TPR) repeat protein
MDTLRAQTALTDLQVLVHHDQGQYVDIRDISWQILGICQQISGDLQAALYSYKQSLRQYPFNNIQSATLMRIHDLG